MSEGLQISKSGNDVVEANEKKVFDMPKSKRGYLPHLIYGIALPYLTGAVTQTDRYMTAALKLKSEPVNAVRECLHEVSCLFEDLATVSKYAEMCDHTHEKHRLWVDVRNHIRHDIREGYDVADDKRKIERAKRLKISPGLQASLVFDLEDISVGETVITLEEIREYLIWAGELMGGILNDAETNGWITTDKIVKDKS